MDEVITVGVNVAARGSPFLWSPEAALQVLAQVRPSRSVRCHHCRVLVMQHGAAAAWHLRDTLR